MVIFSHCKASFLAVYTLTLRILTNPKNMCSIKIDFKKLENSCFET